MVARSPGPLSWKVPPLVRVPVMFTCSAAEAVKSVARTPLLVGLPLTVSVLPFSTSTVPEAELVRPPMVDFIAGAVEPNVPSLVRVPAMFSVFPPPSKLRS